VSLLDRLFHRDEPAGSGGADGIRLVVGLGNPGPEYEATRHNIGFDLLDRLVRERALKWEKEHKFRAKIATGRDGIVFAKPLTYMNLSGNAVSRLMRHQRLSPGRILVVYDDTALSPGALRFRPGGSAGGHNGIKSIIEYLGTEAFPRLRLGVGPAPVGVDLADHVLGPFRPEERVEMEKVLEIAAEGVNYALSVGLDAAMNRFNRRG
jgi:PTH1 family peptidyl-tRNA hydrolase